MRDDNSIGNPSNKTTSNPGYSEEEKKVLAVTSIINGREYVPFMSVDLKERFAFPVPYTGVIQRPNLEIIQGIKQSFALPIYTPLLKFSAE